MPSLRKQSLPALFAALALAGSAGLASVALGSGGGGVGTGGGGGGGGGGDGHNYVFPLPAKHDYGDGFGAGRNHQGQDVFAKCGSRLIANHSGRVQTVDSHSSAGNYIVLDAEGTGKDYAYMHLKQKAIPREGSKVRKGEKIGEVGDTGNASGCHLHFEKWTAPGYYEGGRASPNVTRSLKKWDKYS
jgi:murein DD-endopeptidase MepM/ murein hydrolase activator NlpD